MSSTVNLRKTYNNFLVSILLYCITTATTSACCRCHYRCLCADTVDIAVYVDVEHVFIFAQVLQKKGGSVFAWEGGNCSCRAIAQK